MGRKPVQSLSACTRVTFTFTFISPYVTNYIYIYSFQNVFLRCPTPRLHCFLSSHWPSFRFLSFMAFLTPSIQSFFGLPRALFCFGIHFNAILGNLPSAILWTWSYHVSWFCSISLSIINVYIYQATQLFIVNYAWHRHVSAQNRIIIVLS